MLKKCIKNLSSIKNILDHNFLVTIDPPSLYTNINQEEGAGFYFKKNKGEKN